MTEERTGMKGSFTIEAALLAPLFLLVIFTAMYLHLFTYNRAWCTAAAYEAVVTAATESAGREGSVGELFQNKTEEIERGGNIGCTVRVSGSLSKERAKAVCRGDMPWAYGNRRMQFTAEGECAVIRPAAAIRKVRIAGEFLEAGKGMIGYE